MSLCFAAPVGVVNELCCGVQSRLEHLCLCMLSSCQPVHSTVCVPVTMNMCGYEEIVQLACTELHTTSFALVFYCRPEVIEEVNRV